MHAKLTLPSFCSRLTTLKSVPVAANIVVTRPSTSGHILSSERNRIDDADRLPKGIRASHGTGMTS
jgi:hypothetical protein